MLSQQALDDIRKAIEGLEYPSESDQPFEIVQNVNLAEASEEVSPDAFFNALKDSEDWPRFENLRRALETYLLNIKVFRSNKIRVDIHILGMDQQQQRSGVKTVSVET